MTLGQLHRAKLHTFAAAAIAQASFGGLGCSGDADDTRVGVEAPGGQQPLYLAADTVSGPEGTSSTLCPLGTLDGSERPDYSRCLEVFGRAVPYESEGKLYVVGGEEATITRYDVASDGTFTREDAIGLSQLGVGPSDFSSVRTLIISPDKAYTFHDGGQQVIVWSPRALQITGTIDLSALYRDDGFLLELEARPLRLRDGKLYVTYDYISVEDPNYPIDGAGVLILDTAADAVAKVVAHDRCLGLTDSFESENGDFYFISSEVGAMRAYLGVETEREPCIVRMPSGSDDFDPDYFVNPSTLTGGLPAFVLVGGAGSQPFMRTYDEALGELDKTNVASAVGGVYSYEASDLWRVDLENGTAEKVPGYPTSVPVFYDFEVGGAVLYASVELDYTNAQMWDVAAREELGRSFQGRSEPFAILKLR